MFTKHLDLINKAVSHLQNHPQARSPLGQLVCSGLHVLAQDAAEFDAVVSRTFPFKKHFLSLLTSLHQTAEKTTPVQTNRLQPHAAQEIIPAAEYDEEDVFHLLFEDLALFVRLRALHTGMKKLSEAETAILHYFETCGLWDKDDDHVVCRSYWYELPLAAQTA